MCNSITPSVQLDSLAQSSRIVSIILSDVVPLRSRGTWQGMLISRQLTNFRLIIPRYFEHYIRYGICRRCTLGRIVRRYYWLALVSAISSSSNPHLTSTQGLLDAGPHSVPCDHLSILRSPPPQNRLIRLLGEDPACRFRRSNRARPHSVLLTFRPGSRREHLLE